MLILALDIVTSLGVVVAVAILLWKYMERE